MGEISFSHFGVRVGVYLLISGFTAKYRLKMRIRKLVLLSLVSLEFWSLAQRSEPAISVCLMTCDMWANTCDQHMYFFVALVDAFRFLSLNLE